MGTPAAAGTPYPGVDNSSPTPEDVDAAAWRAAFVVLDGDGRAADAPPIDDDVWSRVERAEDRAAVWLAVILVAWIVLVAAVLALQDFGWLPPRGTP